MFQITLLSTHLIYSPIYLSQWLLQPILTIRNNNAVPNTNYTVRGTLSNVGQVMTQPSVKAQIQHFASQTGEVDADQDQYSLGDIIDEQAIVFSSDESPTCIFLQMEVLILSTVVLTSRCQW